MRLVKFTGRHGTYEFPPQTDGRDNFGDLVPSTSRLAGVNGGIDDYNIREAPQSIGNIQAGWWLIPDEYDPVNSTITLMKDAARAMLKWGKQTLFIQPEDARYGKRHVQARLNNLNASENVRDVPHQRQKVSASFQVNDPAWQGDFAPIFLDDGHYLDDGWHLDGTLYLDDGLVLDDGYALPAMKLEAEATNGGVYTVTNNGTHDARPILKIAARSESWSIGDGNLVGQEPYLDFGAGSPVNTVTVKRITGGALQDEFRWTGYLESGEELIIDSARLAVTHSSNEGEITGYPYFTPVIGFGFMAIPPGDSELEIYGGFGTGDGDSAHIEMHFQDTWY